MQKKVNSFYFLLQVRIIANKMSELMGENGQAIFAGDFNSTPGSAMYKFITTGEMDCAECPSTSISGAPTYVVISASCKLHQVRPYGDSVISVRVEYLCFYRQFLTLHC